MSEELTTSATPAPVAQPIQAEPVTGAPAPAPAEAPQSLDLQNDLKCGYVVGLKNDGNFVFSVVGKEPGLMELLGIHHHASSRVKKLYSANQVTEDALVIELAKMVDALGGMVGQLSQKVDKLLVKVDPPKPNNQL